jgi:phosphatidylinositol kinase/protein kinase (PI-3  family)
MKGSARNNTKDVNTELSIKAQVGYLIDEAMNIENLSKMFIGWTPWL